MRRPAREQVIERGADRVHVAALVDGRTAQLLGRHEPGRTEHDAGARLDRVVVFVVEYARRALWCRRRRARLVALADRLREAPIDHRRLAELPAQDVRRLDVAMHDAALVRVRDRIRRRDDMRQHREASAELGRAPDELFERPPRDLAHDVERRAVRRDAGVVHRHDRRMFESRGDPRLALEAPHRLGIERQRFLERHRAAEQRIVRVDDAAHAAARDLVAVLVAQLRRHLRRRDGRHRRGGVRHHRLHDRFGACAQRHLHRRQWLRLATFGVVCHGQSMSRSCRQEIALDGTYERPREHQPDHAERDRDRQDVPVIVGPLACDHHVRVARIERST